MPKPLLAESKEIWLGRESSVPVDLDRELERQRKLVKKAQTCKKRDRAAAIKAVLAEFWMSSFERNGQHLLPLAPETYQFVGELVERVLGGEDPRKVFAKPPAFINRSFIRCLEIQYLRLHKNITVEKAKDEIARKFNKARSTVDSDWKTKARCVRNYKLEAIRYFLTGEK